MKKLYMLLLLAAITAWASAKTVTVTVDDASKVHMFDNYYKDYTLVNGENLIEVEFGVYEYTFEPVGGLSSFASITFDGKPMNKGNTGYRTYNALNDGTQIVITTAMPEEEYTYRLEYTDAEGVWARATVETMEGGRPVYTAVPVVDNTIKVKAGSTVCLYADNPDAWDVTKITGPAGEEIFWTTATGAGLEPYNAYFIASANGGSVVTTATRKATGNADITVNITGYYASLHLSHGDPLGTDFEAIYGLHEGANSLSVPRSHVVRILSTDGTEKIITYRASAASAEKAAGYDKISMCYFAGPFENGGEINIAIDGDAPVVETFDAALTVDDPADVKAIYTYWSATTVDRNTLLDATLSAGRNTIKVPFDNSSATVRLWIALREHDGMVADVRYRANADAGCNAASEVGDGVYAVSVMSDEKSEIEVTYSEIRTATVSFAVKAADAEIEGVEVSGVRVNGEPVDYSGEPIVVTAGSEVKFRVDAPEGVEYSVSVDGEPIEADAESDYTIIPDADTQVTVSYTVSGAGIASVTAPQPCEGIEYYDLAGRRVGATEPASGIYIRVAGRETTKVIVR